MVPGQEGNDHPTLFPMGTFRTRDGQINIAILLGWGRFIDAIDGAELAEDPRFADPLSRARHREPLREAVEAKLAARTSAEWIEILTRADLPCGPILSMDEVFADPQVEHLNLTRRVEHATEGELEVLRHPVTFSETPVAVRTAPPVAGAHTREILSDCGYAESEIDALVESGAVGLEHSPSG